MARRSLSWRSRSVSPGQGRWWFNILTAGSQWWCGLPGGCYVSTAGTVVSQGEISGGLMVNF
jgi:hypothetical protein